MIYDKEDNMPNLADKLLALEQVERWNFHPHIRRQSVASHSFNVAVITYLLSRYFLKRVDTECIVQALFHDFAESVTGDIPSLVKRYITQFDVIEYSANIEASKVTGKEYDRELFQVLSKGSNDIIHLADALDAWLYAYNEGKQFKSIRQELAGRICRYVESCSEHYSCEAWETFAYLRKLFNYDFTKAKVKELPMAMSHV